MRTIYLILLALGSLAVFGCGSGSDNAPPPAVSTTAPPTAEKKTGQGGAASMNGKSMTLGPGSAQFGSKTGGG